MGRQCRTGRSRETVLAAGQGCAGWRGLFRLVAPRLLGHRVRLVLLGASRAPRIREKDEHDCGTQYANERITAGDEDAQVEHQPHGAGYGVLGRLWSRLRWVPHPSKITRSPANYQDSRFYSGYPCVTHMSDQGMYTRPVRVIRVIGAVAFAMWTFTEFGIAVVGIIAAVLLVANIAAIRWRRAH